MAKIFCATEPPYHGGYLHTSRSDTGMSDRYCIHKTDCSHHKRSLENKQSGESESGNTVGFETSTLDEMEACLKVKSKLGGGIQFCGVCLKDVIKSRNSNGAKK